jgi:hypothetical protein
MGEEDELLIEQYTGSDGQVTSPIKEEGKHAQSLNSLSSIVVDGNSGNRASRVTPRYHAVSTQCTDSQKSWIGLGFWMCLAVSVKNSAVLFETSIAIVQSSRVASAQVHRGKYTNN